MSAPVCHACGHSVDTSMRVEFADACASCGADLHACKGCEHWDPALTSDNECAAGVHDLVRDRAKANKCGAFELRLRPAPKGHRPVVRDSKQAQARAAIDAIFKKPKP